MAFDPPDNRRDIGALTRIMANLRDPAGGCPWDVEQTHTSIAKYAIEEAYEVVDAIERDDMADLKDELGDLLLQVVFHAQMARERGAFDFNDVVEAICDKMVRRHPHVFGDAEERDAETQSSAWEEIKAAERAAKGKADTARILDDVPHALPALTRARKLQKRAAAVGFDWPDTGGVLGKLVEEIDELTGATASQSAEAIEDEYGDVLFTLVNLSRYLKVDPEQALRRTSSKFVTRFSHVEDSVAASGKTFGEHTLDELEAYWQAAKAKTAR